jgi:hypothetical protein
VGVSDDDIGPGQDQRQHARLLSDSGNDYDDVKEHRSLEKIDEVPGVNAEVVRLVGIPIQPEKSWIDFTPTDSLEAQTGKSKNAIRSQRKHRKNRIENIHCRGLPVERQDQNRARIAEFAGADLQVHNRSSAAWLAGGCRPGTAVIVSRWNDLGH